MMKISSNHLNIDGLIHYSLIELGNMTAGERFNYEYNDSFTGKCIRKLDEYIIDVIDRIGTDDHGLTWVKGKSMFFALEDALKGYEELESGHTCDLIAQTGNFKLWLNRDGQTLTIERFNRAEYKWESPLQTCGSCDRFICYPSCDFFENEIVTENK